MKTFSTYLFFFTDTAPTEIYTLSLHDALPISRPGPGPRWDGGRTSRRGNGPSVGDDGAPHAGAAERDRKSTRLNSSHVESSYAVFCLKKKNRALLQAPGTWPITTIIT